MLRPTQSLKMVLLDSSQLRNGSFEEFVFSQSSQLDTSINFQDSVITHSASFIGCQIHGNIEQKHETRERSRSPRKAMFESNPKTGAALHVFKFAFQQEAREILQREFPTLTPTVEQMTRLYLLFLFPVITAYDEETKELAFRYIMADAPAKPLEQPIPGNLAKATSNISIEHPPPRAGEASAVHLIHTAPEPTQEYVLSCDNYASAVITNGQHFTGCQIRGGIDFGSDASGSSRSTLGDVQASLDKALDTTYPLAEREMAVRAKEIFPQIFPDFRPTRQDRIKFAKILAKHAHKVYTVDVKEIARHDLAMPAPAGSGKHAPPKNPVKAKSTIFAKAPPPKAAVTPTYIVPKSAAEAASMS
eukprot:GEMP01048934.1.p1 GENE.GEMP01048934.1~~GEMP01048934.1.p1  ORF type:complete len:361 (+),score=54.20 GEMP01048934.1:201-1283(+)